MENDKGDAFIIDGKNLTAEALIDLAHGKTAVKLSDNAYLSLSEEHDFLERLFQQRLKPGAAKAADSFLSVYGVNTGVGPFVERLIPEEKWNEMQTNIIRSHACATGEPFSVERTRAILLAKINSLASGHTGIRPSVTDKLVGYFNASCIPHIPSEGAGDFRSMHLAHMMLGFLGEGQMWSPKTCWTHADKVLKFNSLEPLELSPKEAVTLITGTDSITALACEVVVRTEILVKQADVIAAMVTEALRASKTLASSFRKEVCALRPHEGQYQSAQRIRALIRSEVFESELGSGVVTKVREVTSLHGTPQVHGMALDTLAFAKNILTVELNSSADGSLLFSDPNDHDDKFLLYGSNSHGVYSANALSYLCIALVHVASISEQRIAKLFTRSSQARLKPGLIQDSGPNTGLVMLHTLACELVAKAKNLAVPCFGSLPSEMGYNDHQSMGSVTVNNAVQVVDITEKVLAIELICACQAIANHLPWETTFPLRIVLQSVMQKIPTIQTDCVMSDFVIAAKEMICTNRLWSDVKRYVQQFAQTFEGAKKHAYGDLGKYTESPIGSVRLRKPSEDGDDATEHDEQLTERDTTVSFKPIDN